MLRQHQQLVDSQAVGLVRQRKNSRVDAVRYNNLEGL